MDVMTRGLVRVTEWLLLASAEVPPEYFHLPVAGAEEPAFRERVYCYELYHRWRCHWLEELPFSLNGEVDKQGHPLIPGAWKPDFIVHVPGKMTKSNLLVVEVKPANGNVRKMAQDLEKLTSFRRDLRDGQGRPTGYHAAYFLVYGLRLDDSPTLRSSLLEEVVDSAQFDRSLIECLVHARAGIRAVRAAWE